ncbi:type II toxin-antitoxin system death-on-curing family toxin [Patescibacteria group bacterium]|nr:type II toxin-antitoxin system death-on-curing family toxin [Patescibacteria group bacterium]MBU4367655.1 type II toxin-antitoxin system death-on-curing family toxin [Patescibacteria group bacterium]MBU4461895.1 type II toxin-antitoxin system death-on-curing family toxin [Patescibacteria group bacterium]
MEYTAFRLAKELMSFDEPIPDFATRFPHILESSIFAPFQKFEKKFLYKGLIGKAAILFYFIIKNHPFQNGNKRIAMTTLMVFLHKNKKWISVDQKEFYNFAVWVATSSPKFKDETVMAIVKFLKSYIVDLKN